MRSSAALALALVLYAIWSAEPIDLFYGGADLGRHLKNGELMFSSAAPKVLHTNFYSYAAPDFPFVNHHWLAGVVFFLVLRIAGFAGLNAFYILLGGLALALGWRLAGKAAGWAIATAVALPMMPILRARPSVRPEIFSVLLCTVFLWILWEHYYGSFGWRTLLVLPVVEVLWVNLHIGFIFGPVFVGAFLLKRGIDRKRWAGILALTLAATLVNPSGIHGALYPLTIWGNYGLDMVENHSIPYLESNGYSGGEFLAIKLTLVILAVSFLVAGRRARPFPFVLLALGALMSGMAWFAIRNQTLLAMFALPAVGINLGLSGIKWPKIAVSVAIAAGVCYNGYRLLTRDEQIGLGLKAGTSAPAEFLRASHLEGPVLNNAGIGGYLTFYLFPQYRIYVDSRPEAFPATFMQQKYIEPLNDETRWKQLLDEYHFNLICSSGSAAWENRFIARRAMDQDWAVIYAQAPSIILARRSPQNQGFIQLHEIPKDRLFKTAP